MPSSEELDAVRDRQELEAILNREAVERIKKAQEMEKAQRKSRRARFLERPMSLDDMFKQSCARVYYMKSNKISRGVPGTASWDAPKVADKLLSKFKYNKRHADQTEALLQAAFRIDNEKMIAEYRASADKYLTACLYAHYGIGVLYGQFLDTARPETETVIGAENPYED